MGAFGLVRRRVVPLLPRTLREGVRRLLGRETPYMVPRQGLPAGVAPWQRQHILRHLPAYEDAVRELLRVSGWLTVVAEKDASQGRDKLGTGYSPGSLGQFWANAWDPVRLKRFARGNGAAIAFTLNDAKLDDPGAQYIYVFER